LGSQLDLSGSRDIISHMTIQLVGDFLLVVLWNQLASVSEMFNDECNAMVDVTLNVF